MDLSENFVKLESFIHGHEFELKSWVEECHKCSPNLKDWDILKSFIRHLNLPFCMETYMQSQRSFIEKNIANAPECKDSMQKQKLVQQWIYQHAKGHRAKWIDKQIDFLDQNKADILKNLNRDLYSAGLKFHS